MKEFSADDSQATIEATSSTFKKRFRGILLSKYWIFSSLILSKILVLATAGVMQLTAMSNSASSFPRDLVRAITPALAALYAAVSYTHLTLPTTPYV